jgi:anti-sigma factor RsiW
MTHLGDVAAALAGGELSHDARDRALAHLAGCDECRAEVDAQRRLRALLGAQPDPVPAPELLARLRGIPTAVDDNADGGWTPPQPVLFAAASTRPRAAAGGSRRPAIGRGARGRRRAVRRMVAGSASALALTMALAAIGGPADGGGSGTVSPPVDQFVQSHTVTRSRLPLGDPGAGVVESVTWRR